MAKTIYEEIDERWRVAFTGMHWEPLSRDNFQKMLSDAETEARVKTAEGLQPQLGILEFGLEWLAYVYVALSNNHFLPANEDCRAPGR